MLSSSCSHMISSNSLIVCSMSCRCLLALFYSENGMTLWYPPLKSFIWIDLAHAQACIWLNKKSIKPWWFTLPQSSYIVFMPILICFVASMIMTETALSIVASQSFASLHLYWEGILLVHPIPENQVIPKSPL
jgi:hypothetical protein